MELTQMKKAGLVLVAILTTTSLYASDPTRAELRQNQAKIDCTYKIAESGKYQFIDAKHVVDKGHRSYKVTGEAESRRNGEKYNFTCSIRHKEVVDWRVTKHSSHSDKNTAIAAGAGIIALAAIVAAANNKHDNHDEGASAFDDMRYLKKQCRQNLRHHINREDQPVRKIHLDTAHLHNRTLVGEGGVLFRRGGGNDIAYRCKFDRQGRIYDGHYRFH